MLQREPCSKTPESAMYESFGFEELTAPQAAVYFALILGTLFGFLAERTKFCFRRSLIGDDAKSAAGVWLTALGVAILGTQAAAVFGLSILLTLMGVDPNGVMNNV